MERFRTDTANLRRRLDRRAASLKREREPHETVWKEIRRHFEPQFGRPIDNPAGAPADRNATLEDSAIINSHPRLALSRLGAGMHGGITSPSTQWFRLVVDDPSVSERPDATDWLDDLTQDMSGVFSRSNTYLTLHQSYLHLVFGNSCFLVVPDPDTTLHTLLLDEGSYWLAADRKGRVNTLLRCFSFTASQIRDEFGDAAAQADNSVAQSLARQADDDNFTVWNLIMPNDGSASPDIPKDRPFLSVYWRDGSPADTVLDIRSYSYNPIIAPRWHVLSGVYGFGPGHIALSDAKELQKLEADRLKAIAKITEPPVTVPESMRDEPINTFPGGITYRKDGGLDPERRPSVAPLYEVNPDLSHISAIIAEVERRIDQNFFVDLFAMMLNLNQRPKQMTAREVNELAAEKMALLGPVLSRLNVDMLDPLIEAAYAIMLAAGRVQPPPEALNAQPITVKYVSILHTEQQSTSRLGAMIRLTDFLALVSPASPECADKLDADQAVDEAAKVLAVPSRIIRPDQQVADIRRQRDQARQAAVQAEALKAAPGLASAAKTLSETTSPPGSALSMLTAGPQQ